MKLATLLYPNVHQAQVTLSAQLDHFQGVNLWPIGMIQGKVDRRIVFDMFSFHMQLSFSCSMRDEREHRFITPGVSRTNLNSFHDVRLFCDPFVQQNFLPFTPALTIHHVIILSPFRPFIPSFVGLCHSHTETRDFSRRYCVILYC